MYSKRLKLEKYILMFIVAMGFFTIVFAQYSNIQETKINRQNGLVSQTYNRATNCFQAVPVEVRTDEYISSCYDKAEEATGTKIERYGN